MRHLLATTLLLLAGCSGETQLDLGTNRSEISGTASIDGTVNGKPIATPKISAARMAYHGYTVLHVSISAAADFDGVCTGVQKANTSGLFLEIWEQGGAISTGSHAAAKGVYVSESSLSDDCGAAFGGDSHSAAASIEIDAIDEHHVEGRFHGTFGNGEVVTGQFSAPFCASPQINPELEPCNMCGQSLPNYSCK